MKTIILSKTQKSAFDALKNGSGAIKARLINPAYDDYAGSITIEVRIKQKLRWFQIKSFDTGVLMEDWFILSDKQLQKWLSQLEIEEF